jgi:excisionase family DNA binding protein
METEGLRQMSKKKMTVYEAGEHFQVSHQTIRRWMREGRITVYRFGPRMVRLDPDEMERELMRKVVKAR